MAYDIIAVGLAYFLGLWLRYDCNFSQISPDYLRTFIWFIPFYGLMCVAVFWRLRLYNSLWRFASTTEFKRAVWGTLITSIIHIIGASVTMYLLTGRIGRMPISYYMVGMGLQFLAVLGIRFSYRFVLLERAKRKKANAKLIRVMLVGAGDAGEMILREIQRMKEETMQVCCIIDDNPNKWGRYIENVPIVGGRNEIIASAEKYQIDKIFVAVPSASADDKREILNICKETGCELKNLPGIYQMMFGYATLGDLKDVAVEDLLGREPIRVNMDQISRHIRGRVVMVTGGGGSIGSELCRQVAAYDPKQLIIFDVYENNAYEIQQELKEKYPALEMKVLIGSVRDSRRMNEVFDTYRPQIVYHAAAHKHVPLMEDSACEAIKNNVIGTYKTAFAAMTHGCERFVLISTDKAVNPTNIMGASKRLCEMVIQSFDRAMKEGKADKLPMLYTHNTKDGEGFTPQLSVSQFKTDFVAVRFGNVLGSNGSVIPLFKKQIAKGGPVTVTHPDIIRYFMTIPEAVSLVMQAGTYAKGGEIFVLDMGAPVKIDELARNLIKLSGLKPDEDIPIVYTGLRPGEKLYEEKLMAEEGMQKTENDLIHIGNPLYFDTDAFLEQLEKLMHAAHNNTTNIIPMVEAMVPTYHPDYTGIKDATYEKLRAETVGAK
ncbi:MAG: polysaccharide biosynthesis protein [Oscillospiraceae bacterium]|nr:polysaccharide biosynthesis protein [Oscillospiraceae bacterium]